MIFHVFSLTVLNAYLCYKMVTPNSPMLHRVFRKKLVTNLIESVDIENLPKSGRRSTTGRPSTAPDPIMRLQGKHFPTKLVATGKKRNITRACVCCSVAEREVLATIGEKRRRPGHESSYKCGQCDTVLCIDPCFRLYHTYKDYVSAYKNLLNNND